MTSYNGKHVWIIGASTGIGEALATELNKCGANLILSSRSQAKLEDLNKAFESQHQVLSFDVSDFKKVKSAANKIKKIDLVVFLAAIYSPHSEHPKSVEFIHSMINVNLGGAFNTVHAVTEIFEKQGFGHIALCASVAGYRGLPYGQPYCATKAAIINYAESLKIEFEPKNIKVQVINPGFVKSPLTDKNDFTMPMIMETDKAAKALANGLLSNRFEIHFPKRFTFIMKFLRILPSWLYFPVARHLRDKQ